MGLIELGIMVDPHVFLRTKYVLRNKCCGRGASTKGASAECMTGRCFIHENVVHAI